MERPKLLVNTAPLEEGVNWEEYYDYLKQLTLVEQYVVLRGDIKALNKAELNTFLQDKNVRQFVSVTSKEIGDFTLFEKEILSMEAKDGNPT